VRSDLAHDGGFGARLRWIRIGAVAAISSVTQIALTIAFTSLVFRGPLVGDLRLGLAAMFAGLAIAGVTVAIRSGLPGPLAGPQDSGLVVISAMVPAIVATTDRPGPTVLVLMALGSLGVGVTMYALGTLGLGRMIRYLPFPVMAGFLAGTGLVMARSTLELLDAGITGDATAGADRLLRIAIGGATALALVAISRSRLPTERVLPTLVLGVITTVHIGLALQGIGRTEAAARGFLLPELSSGPMVSTASLRFALDADWGIVADHAVDLLPLLLLAPITLLLYLGALEALLDTDVETNREFRLIGEVNVASSVTGAAPSYTQLAATMLIERMAAGSRVVPAVVGFAGLVAIALGDLVVALAPQPVVAGLLGFIALSFVIDWLWDTAGRMTRIEWVMAVAIALSILVFGFLPGVAIGISMAAAWFVVEYSRMSGVRRLRDATYLRSNVERTGGELDELARTGNEVLVVEPEGFLFFGTGDSIARAVMDAAPTTPLRYVIIDFTMVTGADSSAAAALAQLGRWTRQASVEMIWCALRPRVRRSLRPLLDTDGFVETPDLDRALEHTERDRLADRDVDSAPGLLDEIPELRSFGRRRSFAPGEAIFSAGEPGPGLMVLEAGWAEVMGAAGVRRRRVGPGAVLGEIGLVLDTEATATVVADTEVDALVLDRDGAARLGRDAPDRAAALYRFVARSLSQRLLRSDAELASFSFRHDAPGVADETSARST
jgi:SulP family sulfate permease